MSAVLRPETALLCGQSHALVGERLRHIICEPLNCEPLNRDEENEPIVALFRSRRHVRSGPRRRSFGRMRRSHIQREQRHNARRVRRLLLRAGLVTIVLAVAAAAFAVWPRDPIRLRRAALDRGNRYFAQKKFAEAVIEYKRAIQIDPRFGEAHSQLAEAYARIDDSRNAFVEYVTAADLRPADLAAQVRAGNALLLMGYAKEAGERADRVLAADPGNFDAKLLRVNVTAGLKNLDDAVVQMYRLTESVAEKPADQARALLHLGVMELARGHAADAEGILLKATERESASVVNHTALANYYWVTGRREDAEAELRRVLAIDPHDSRANRALAAMLITSGRTAEAELPLEALSESSDEPSARLVLADYYIVAERFDVASALLKDMARDTAFFAQAQLRLALIAYKAGRAGQAEQIVDAALEKEPTHPALLLMKARMLAERHRFDDAFARVKAALAVEPKSAEAQYLLGSMYTARNQPDEAIAAFNQVLKLRPNLTDALVRLSSLHLARNDPDTAARFAVQAVTNTPASADARIALFRALIARGNLDEAEHELKPALDANPRAPVILTQWGRLLAARQDVDGARTYLADALAIDPNALEPLGELVGVELSAGRAADALALVTDRLQRTPNDPTVLLLAARIYGATGDPARVEATLQRVIELDPSNLRAFGALGQLYYAAGRLPDARQQFEALAAQNPRSAGAVTMLAVIRQMEGNSNDAQATYERALAIDPNAAVASNNLAWLELKQGGNLDVALQHAQTAKAAFPNEPEFNDTLGWVYVNKHLPDLALEPLLESTRAEPDNASFRFHLAMAYIARSDYRLARPHLERAIALHQEFEGLDEARRQLESLRNLPLGETEPDSGSSLPGERQGTR